LENQAKFKNENIYKNLQIQFLSVPHLAGPTSIPTHITLDRQLISAKAGGLVYHT